ncbi:MAG: hypothetical protein LBK98_02560 [Peptococcaceae bacterium]|jgi:class I fructose-bisphosphate aldolase|nr:hypothetical protein [Peptococcaceae bacterium]
MRHWNKELRFNRLFDNCGKTVMVAMDHGQGGVKPGLAHPERLLRVIVDANPDAILLGSGMARVFNWMFGGKNKPALVISSDFIVSGGVPQREGEIEHVQQSISVEECARLGADGIKALLVFGKRDMELHTRNMRYITELAEECDRWNMPLIVEPTAWGAELTAEERGKAALYADMARIAAELGADMVKCDFVGAPEEFRQVVDNCPVPITILGGGKAEAGKLAYTIEAAAKCGARGVVFGRNVWQSPDPAKMVRALKAITYTGDRDTFLSLCD